MIPLSRPHPQARYVVPEVVQTSMMDCGPAALQALVAGFGMSVNFGRLREACQTSVDGTSITTMDEIASFLGLDTEEMMIPADHLLVPEARALPAIVVVKTPSGGNHFVVVWSTSGRWVQVMDPAEGRSWLPRAVLFERLYLHKVQVPASAWRAWAGEREFLSVLDARLAALEIARADRDRLCAAARAHPGWEDLAALDAATRMTTSLRASGVVAPGAVCLSLIERQVERRADGVYPLLAGEYRSAWRSSEQSGEWDEETLRVRGVVLVRVRGRREVGRAVVVAPDVAGDGGSGAAAPSDESRAVTGDPAAAAGHPAGGPTEGPAEIAGAAGAAGAAALPAELAAAMTEEPIRPWRTLLGLLVADGLATPATLGLVLVASAALITANAVLLRGILEVGQQLGLASQRAVAMAVLLGVLALGLLVEVPLVAGALRLGRTLDLRLRMAFLAKLPRLDDRYFRSRLLSDMAERGHSLHQIRSLPVLGVRLLSAAAQLVLTVAGIAWIHPASAPIALLAAGVCIAMPIAAQPLMAERDLRVRGHAGALGRFYLDALLGLVPIRVHGARPAMQRQQEALLIEWAHAGRRFYTAATAVEGALALCGLGVAVVMVWSVSSHPTGGLLLLVYWALSLPALGQDLAIAARQYPALRNVILRLLEPLGTPEPIEPIEPPGPPGPPGHVRAAPALVPDTASAGGDRGGEIRGVAIRMADVAVEAGGHTVLDAVDLAVSPGEHVAIVGPSGAGKSSLVGLLLGWHRPARGSLKVDGRPLVGDRLSSLRRETAWVDPAVALWNRSFLDNLRYGAAHDAELPVTEILARARLREVLEHLPDGLATELGEGGARISGGEGQRTRLGRALARPRARLVILDEPFRGLDRATRQELLAMVRRWWRGATLLWVTHDIAQTESFGRVVVIDGGRIVEDGEPAELGARSGSRYAALVRGDRDMHDRAWSGATWRRVWIERGVLREEASGS